MQKKHIYFFIGTTAELIKIAPVIKEFKNRGIKFKIITSGQNKINFKDLSDFIEPIKADISFKEKANKSSMFHFIFWAISTFFICLIKLRKEFKGINKQNSYFIIHGDTVSSTIGAIIATFYQIKLVHIEAGYLSFNIFEPFPEEICRNINIRLADILFSPTDWAKNNLRELRGVKISTKENTMIDTFWWAMRQKSSPLNKKIKKYYILILHRQEHVLFRRDWSKKILEFVIKNADKDLDCYLLNYPLTVDIIKSLNLDQEMKRIKVISPLPYPEFIRLMNNAEFIASDGCTNQQETYYMGKPFLALRDRTEQSEGMGRNVILCMSDAKIIKDFLMKYNKYKAKPVHPKISPAKIIINYLSIH